MHWLPIQLFTYLYVSLHYLQNWQNYTAFSHGNLAVETLSKIVSAVEDSANTKCEHFLSREKCSMSSITFHILLSHYC